MACESCTQDWTRETCHRLKYILGNKLHMNNSRACSLIRLIQLATECPTLAHKRPCSTKRDVRIAGIKGNKVSAPDTGTNLGCWRNAWKPQRRTRWPPGQLQPSASIWYRPTRWCNLSRKRGRPALECLSNHSMFFFIFFFCLCFFF